MRGWRVWGSRASVPDLLILSSSFRFLFFSLRNLGLQRQSLRSLSTTYQSDVSGHGLEICSALRYVCKLPSLILQISPSDKGHPLIPPLPPNTDEFDFQSPLSYRHLQAYREKERQGEKKMTSRYLSVVTNDDTPRYGTPDTSNTQPDLITSNSPNDDRSDDFQPLISEPISGSENACPVSWCIFIGQFGFPQGGNDREHITC